MKWPKDLAAQPEPPASDADIVEFAQSVFAPLSANDIRELHAEHKTAVGDDVFDPPFDPASWQLPKRPLPESYLTFLRYSNGGFFAGQNRDLDPLFNTREVRDYMLGYSVPHWMPMSCPIGFDGGGTFYLLDMRLEPQINDYPVLFAHASNLGYDDAVTLANSFAELVNTQLGQA